jgi:hypothetical protein
LCRYIGTKPIFAKSVSAEIEQSKASLSDVVKTPRLEKPVRITEQTWPEGTVPVVSVFNWAYNHEAFIRASIESILMQETTFRVEIIIHDDASTDGTTEIIREYEAKYPQLFRNIIQTANQWSQGKSVMSPMFTAPRGEFVALSHGDDYWTSPHKLQSQVMKLLNKSSASGCFHIAGVLGPEGSIYQVIPPPEIQRDRDLADAHFNFWLPTGSLVYRRVSLTTDMGWAEHLPMGDVPLFAELCSVGPLLFVPEQMSVYRKHDAGIWTGRARRKQLEDMLALQQAMYARFGERCTRTLRKSIKNLRASLFGVCVEEGRKRDAIKYLFRYFISWPPTGNLVKTQKRNLLRYFGVLGHRKPDK